MNATIKNSTYESIPMQSLNEAPAASSENTNKSSRYTTGDICIAFGLGVAVVILASVGVGMGVRSMGGNQLSTSSPPSGHENNKSITGYTVKPTTVTNFIDSTTEQLINNSISSTPNVTVITPKTPWANSSQETTAFKNTSESTQRPSINTTDISSSNKTEPNLPKNGTG